MSWIKCLTQRIKATTIKTMRPPSAFSGTLGGPVEWTVAVAQWQSIWLLTGWCGFESRLSPHSCCKNVAKTPPKSTKTLWIGYRRRKTGKSHKLPDWRLQLALHGAAWRALPRKQCPESWWKPARRVQHITTKSCETCPARWFRWTKFGRSPIANRPTFQSIWQGQDGVGDTWTWIAIDADTKLIPSWHVGLRDSTAAYNFIHDLKGRLANRVQLTSDGHRPYLQAVEDAFGSGHWFLNAWWNCMGAKPAKAKLAIRRRFALGRAVAKSSEILTAIWFPQATLNARIWRSEWQTADSHG